MKSTERGLSLCHADTSQLLVIDVQERLANAIPEDCLASLEQNIVRLVSAARELDIPIITTEQYPKGLGSTLETISSQLPGNPPAFDKTCFSCCTADGFEERLTAEDRRQVVVAGLEAHVCVLQTAAGLMQWGYDVFVVGDAVCSRSPDNLTNGLQRMAQGGAVITNTESVVFEWLQDARHPAFKNLSNLIR